MHEEPGSGLTSQGNADLPLCLCQSLGASGIGLEKTRERFREGLLQASLIVTVETPHMDMQADLTPKRRKICRLPNIGTVHAATDVPACRATAMGSVTLHGNYKGVLA